jgi:hypothetical protein
MNGDRSGGLQGKGIMRVRSGHWLDCDPISLVVLVIGIGADSLLACSI